MFPFRGWATRTESGESARPPSTPGRGTLPPALVRALSACAEEEPIAVLTSAPRRSWGSRRPPQEAEAEAERDFWLDEEEEARSSPGPSRRSGTALLPHTPARSSFAGGGQQWATTPQQSGLGTSAHGAETESPAIRLPCAAPDAPPPPSPGSRLHLHVEEKHEEGGGGVMGHRESSSGSHGGGAAPLPLPARQSLELQQMSQHILLGGSSTSSERSATGQVAPDAKASLHSMADFVLCGDDSDDDEVAELLPPPQGLPAPSLSSERGVETPPTPCRHADRPPRYRNTAGYCCSYCCFTVCYRCYERVVWPALPLSRRNPPRTEAEERGRGSAETAAIDQSGCAIMFESVRRALLAPAPSAAASASPPTPTLHTPQQVRRSRAVEGGAGCPSSTAPGLDVAGRGAAVPPHPPQTCLICRSGVLERAAALLHEWSCEGPEYASARRNAAQRLRQVYETEQLQRYHFIKEQRRQRQASTARLHAVFLGRDPPSPLFALQQQQQQEEEEAAASSTPPQRTPPEERTRSARTAHSGPSLSGPGPGRPVCEEGGSFYFGVHNPRLETACVWCAVNFTGWREELAAFAPGATVVPLLSFLCPPSLPGLPPRTLRVTVPYGCYALHSPAGAAPAVQALALYTKADIYRKAVPGLAQDGGLRLVKRAPAPLVKPLLVVEVLHHVATTPTPIQLQPTRGPRGSPPSAGAEASWPAWTSPAELRLCVDHLLQGRSVAVFGIGSKAPFLRHLLQSAQLQNFTPFVLDTVSATLDSQCCAADDRGDYAAPSIPAAASPAARAARRVLEELRRFLDSPPPPPPPVRAGQETDTSSDAEADAPPFRGWAAAEDELESPVAEEGSHGDPTSEDMGVRLAEWSSLFDMVLPSGADQESTAASPGASPPTVSFSTWLRAHRCRPVTAARRERRGAGCVKTATRLLSLRLRRQATSPTASQPVVVLNDEEEAARLQAIEGPADFRFLLPWRTEDDTIAAYCSATQRRIVIRPAPAGCPGRGRAKAVRHTQEDAVAGVLHDPQELRNAIDRLMDPRRHERRCVRWLKAPSGPTPTPVAANTRAGDGPALLVLPRIDLLDPDLLSRVAALCVAYAAPASLSAVGPPPGRRLLLVAAFDHPSWPRSAACAALGAPLAYVQLATAHWPRLDERRAVRPLDFLLQHETSHGVQRGDGRHRLPLSDTLRRVLHSLPASFGPLLQHLIAAQEEAGEGHYVSVFLLVEILEQRTGTMLSQGRWRALQRELTSNRLALYDPAEHALLIPQPRRLLKVLEEVTKEREARDTGWAEG